MELATPAYGQPRGRAVEGSANTWDLWATASVLSHCLRLPVHPHSPRSRSIRGYDPGRNHRGNFDLECLKGPLART
jgi:hypothetical protein